jgi:hypothetical protein
MVPLPRLRQRRKHRPRKLLSRFRKLPSSSRARWSCLRPDLVRCTRHRRHHRPRPLRQPEPTQAASSAAGLSLTAVRNLAPAVVQAISRLALRAAQARPASIQINSRIRVHRASTPAAQAVRAPSILLAPASSARAEQAVPAHVPASVLDLALAHHVPAVSAEHPVLHRLQAKLHALRVLQDRRVAVAVNNIPRPKKAR